ncbi:hypothetical protein [Variovorax ginsengisoli]|jgi:hypothetical protein|uniref:Uncharacterized protein n=1 Tax=Variovorax ginsengisoli TaxID=363844 RepID=A0ABT8S9G8_9BURK|nr:hypothetical protein [Variovorax ginsengisoli]MDN8615779.1 hypothetical protein [Variovorax ginsengisoli]MDO1534949.1 hypothetical protein [Variovorax ginsengisoli]
MKTPRRDASNEEPELGAEESIPLDGKDPVGEQMMKELGRDSGKRADQHAKEEEGDPGPLPEQFPAS